MINLHNHRLVIDCFAVKSAEKAPQRNLNARLLSVVPENLQHQPRIHETGSLSSMRKAVIRVIEVSDLSRTADIRQRQFFARRKDHAMIFDVTGK